MILPERLSVYLESLQSGNGTFLDELENEARLKKVPVIQKQMQGFLQVLLLIQHPKKILEVGTGTGFSSLFMAKYTPDTTLITTIENNEKRVTAAKENIQRAGMQDRIELKIGDAKELLGKMTGSYDLIFMDAAKGQYVHLLPDVLRLLEKDGVLLTDNVLQDGDILESHYAVKRRNRTIYKRMREYLFELTHTNGLETSIIPLGDGAALTVKCPDPAEK